MGAEILIADDDLQLLGALSESLRQLGAHVVCARDGGELIEALEEGPYDLIVTDVSMPWMTGLQATHSARYAGLETPILVITALTDPKIDDVVAALGPRARLLRKPFDLESFEAAVRDLLEVGERAAGVPS